MTHRLKRGTWSFLRLREHRFGVRDAKYAQFDIDKVIERLLLKGNIVVKKAYCDWPATKNSNQRCPRSVLRADRDPTPAPVGQELRDIRMVVDALDFVHERARGHLRHHQW